MSAGPIFLSASVPYPDPKRNPDFRRYSCDAVAVREAVRALVSVIVPHRSLVFGGHPAITPFIFEAASSLNALEFIFIYQSELYRALIPGDVPYFRNLVWTPAFPGADPSREQDRETCLQTMRQWMIVDRRIDGRQQAFPPYAAGVFIGGMEGVETEWEIFTKNYNGVPAWPIGSTEGAAERLLDNQWKGPAASRHALTHELRYRSLFRTLIP